MRKSQVSVYKEMLYSILMTLGKRQLGGRPTCDGYLTVLFFSLKKKKPPAGCGRFFCSNMGWKFASESKIFSIFARALGYRCRFRRMGGIGKRALLKIYF